MVSMLLTLPRVMLYAIDADADAIDANDSESDETGRRGENMPKEKKYRITFSLTKEQLKALGELKKTDRYCWGSMGEVIRDLIDIGLRAKGYISDTN